MSIVLSQLEKYEKMSIDQLQNFFKPNDIQRVVHEDRVIEMYEDMFETYRSRKVHLCPGVLIVAECKGVKYLVDGQHRFKALCMLKEKTGYSAKVVVNTINVSTMEEIHDLFNRINKMIPASQLPDGLDVATSNVVAKYFIEGKYKNIFKSSQSPRVPHIQIQMFESVVRKIVLVFPKLSPQDIISTIEAVNDDLSHRSPQFFLENTGSTYTINEIEKKLNDARIKGGLYFGMYKNLECLNTLTGDVAFTKRKRITPALRKQVWNNQFTEEVGTCPFCESKMDVNTFEVAHDIAHSNGGGSDLDNLYCCCKGCNLSMGKMTFEEFRLRCGRELL
jgi:hypothetical protein